MSKHFALSHIQYNGRSYFRGDEIPGLTAEVIRQLGDAISSKKPGAEEPAPEPVGEPVPAAEPEADPAASNGVPEPVVVDPDTGETAPPPELPVSGEAKDAQPAPAAEPAGAASTSAPAPSTSKPRGNRS